LAPRASPTPQPILRIFYSITGWHLGPGPARSRSAQPARSIPTLLIRLGSIRARSPSGSGSSLSGQAEPQGLRVNSSLFIRARHTRRARVRPPTPSRPPAAAQAGSGRPPGPGEDSEKPARKEGPYVDNCLMAMGDGLTGGYWLEGTVVAACGDEPNGPDAQSHKEPSCSTTFDPPRIGTASREARRPGSLPGGVPSQTPDNTVS